MQPLPNKKFKINFKQPKFVIPIILLPFLSFFVFIFQSFGAKKEEVLVSNVGDNSINYELPESSIEVKDQDLKNKLDAFRVVYGKNTDMSALNGLDDLDVIDNEFESAYTTEDERQLARIMRNDSTSRAVSNRANKDLATITNLLNARGNPNAQAKLYASMSNVRGDEADDFNKKFGHLFNKNSSNIGGSPYGGYGEEEDDFEESSMRLFTKQMKYIDSVNQVKEMQSQISANHANSSLPNTNGLNSRNFQPNHAERNVLPVKYSKPTNSFNTVSVKKKSSSQGIPAIIDQDKKGMTSTRLRIKLMSDMIVGDNLLKKGSYLYGFVSGFSTQRVMISISQIMYKGENLDVNLDVYDNDGYMGLYVPGSMFREFTKEVGDQSTRGLTSITTSENQNQITQNLLNSLFSGGSNAASKLITANKVQFKYNYVIFLKENKTNQEL